MKNARAKRAKILFFIVKYANFFYFCYRRRRGSLSSQLTQDDTEVRQGSEHVRLRYFLFDDLKRSECLPRSVPSSFAKYYFEIEVTQRKYYIFL